MLNENITILFVDDEESVLHSLERFLIHEPYRFLYALNGNQALEIMADQAVHVVVTDMKMPGMDGLELLKQVKHLYPDTVRLVLSGYSQVSSIIFAINSGEIYKYITKPIEPEVFRQILNDAINFYLLNQDRQELVNSLKSRNHELSLAVAQKNAAQKKLGHAQSRIEQTLLRANPHRDAENLDIAVLSRSANNIGGDFYDFIKTVPSGLDILLGDVMGKGILAALVAAGTKQCFLKALAETSAHEREAHLSPALLTQRVQQLITPGLFELENFVTTLFVRIDLEKKSLVFSDCGHTPILHYSVSGQQCRLCMGSNTPLGVQKEEKIQETSIDIQTGDLIVLLSDGILETGSPDNELYGIERLCRFINTHHHNTPGKILDRLEKQLDRFRDTRELQDDLTCICIRIQDTGIIKKQFNNTKAGDARNPKFSY